MIPRNHNKLALPSQPDELVPIPSPPYGKTGPAIHSETPHAHPTPDNQWAGYQRGDILFAEDLNESLSHRTRYDEVVLLTGNARMTGPLYLWQDPGAYDEAATKGYVDRVVVSSNAFLPLSGGTLTGPLILAGPPTVGLGAATKAYVDTQISSIPPPAGGASVTVGDTAPVSPANGDLWFDAVSTQLYVRYDDGSGVQWVIANNVASGPITYDMLPAEVQQVPLSFPFVGKPSAAMAVYVPMPWALTIPASLAGTVGYCVTNPTSAATFTLNRIRSGASTALGTIQISTGGAVTLSGSGGSLVIGDVLQLVAPTAQDSALSDVGVTILGMRV